MSATDSAPDPSVARDTASHAARVPVLHAVTSDEIVQRPDFVPRARRVMHAGADRVAVHLRVQRLRGRALYDLACQLVEVQNATGAWLVVNDRADVALAAGARGVQLTSRSMSVEDGRRAAPSLPIGASVHSPEDAERAVEAGAQWIVAGHVLETEPHPAEQGQGVAFIERLATVHAVPVIAIGGIRPEHVAALKTAGAYGVAAIRGVWNASDAGAAVIDYLSAHGALGGR
ncbi:MAG TPA: thiamine phosphate synthase [Gemmatimonadaceae bacterium]|jgi:thiazole tautomerase (transcriptional regulator TenI)|nr:thiamine phosphate synthase [Gemmatimonadaceae bacterium]